MIKNYIFVIALSISMSAIAQQPQMHISLKDGSTQTFNVADINEMTFSDGSAEQSPAELLAGEYNGTNQLAVGALATYSVVINPVITANSDGTINFTYPKYDIPNTLMGNLTLGTLTISDIPYVEEENAFVLDYSKDGLQQHFTCVTAQGTTSMDSDYTLGDGSIIRIEVAGDGIKVTNPFKLGAMPFPLTATFEGKKVSGQ